jgi:hypothetical protein
MCLGVHVSFLFAFSLFLIWPAGGSCPPIVTGRGFENKTQIGYCKLYLIAFCLATAVSNEKWANLCKKKRAIQNLNIQKQYTHVYFTNDLGSSQRLSYVEMDFIHALLWHFTNWY